LNQGTTFDLGITVRWGTGDLEHVLEDGRARGKDAGVDTKLRRLCLRDDATVRVPLADGGIKYRRAFFCVLRYVITKTISQVFFTSLNLLESQPRRV
jgi:hypothetical protein